MKQILVSLLAAARDVRKFQGIAYNGPRQFIYARTRNKRIADSCAELGIARQYPCCNSLHNTDFHLDVVTSPVNRWLTKLGAERVGRGLSDCIQLFGHVEPCSPEARLG